jgi:tRNA(Ile)-lysidine synthetase-like protein
VAQSGGPDSTCLLFLLNRYVSNSSELVSLTVDHGLQASSREMAEQCQRTATALGVHHITSRIPWSVPPFPALPSKDEPFERIARETRYHVLFQNMLHVHAPILAFGHHADDQAETSLMRLGKFTTELGAGGMRRCRRWGMGFGRDSRSIGWAGYEGMDRWILRPLLNVSKVRADQTNLLTPLDLLTVGAAGSDSCHMRRE